MMKRLNQEEFITKALARAKRPIDLSQFEYRGSEFKSVAICPQHGPFEISANALMNGIGCAQCALEERSSKRRMPITEFVERATTRHKGRYDYSSVAYRNATTKVTILCSEHGPFEQTPNAHLSGRGCPKCGDVRVGLISRLDGAAFMQRVREVHGDTYDLSKINYVRMTDKIEVVCREHGSFFPTAANFLGRKSGCPTCGRERAGEKSRKPLSYYVVRGAKTHKGKFGYKGVTYKNQAAYLKVVCPIHGEFEQLAQDHLKGIGCERCARPIGDTATFIEAAQVIHGEKYDYSKVNYTGTTSKVEIICREHGSFWQTPNMHANQAQGCPRCGCVGPSVGQLEILEFLKQYTPVIDRYKIGRKEVDIYLPEHQIGVEYHGLIWHSTRFARTPTEDFKKHKLFEKHGIRIIHIYQDEWEQRRPRVERLLLSAIGKSSGDRLYARDLEIVEIDAVTADQFYDEHHIQGAIGTPCTSIALSHNGTPVAVMSFSRIVSIRGSKRVGGEYELRRFATSCSVVGGASRLLAHFIRLTGDVKRVVSYSDNRLFNGRMYEALGFTKDYVSNPSYCYVTTNTRLGRLPKTMFKRSALAKMIGFSFDPNLSERENCESNGYYQLHDCGKTRWVMTV